MNIQKAYDKVNRNFICYMLKRTNFPEHIIQLIHACIITPIFSVLVNQGRIASNRGIRQGDPLSPYLFCIAMEYLSLKLEGANRRGASHLYTTESIISHLSFADDVMIFATANIKSAITLVSITEGLCRVAGLYFDLTKSTLVQIEPIKKIFYAFYNYKKLPYQ